MVSGRLIFSALYTLYDKTQKSRIFRDFCVFAGFSELIPEEKILFC